MKVLSSCLAEYTYLMMNESLTNEDKINKLNQRFNLNLGLDKIKDWCFAKETFLVEYDRKEVSVTFNVDYYIMEVNYGNYIINYIYNRDKKIIRKMIQYNIGNDERIYCINDLDGSKSFEYSIDDMIVDYQVYRNDVPFCRSVFWQKTDIKQDSYQTLKQLQIRDSVFYFLINRLGKDNWNGYQVRCNLGLIDEENLGLQTNLDYLMIEHDEPYIDFYFYKANNDFDFITIKKENLNSEKKIGIICKVDNKSKIIELPGDLSEKLSFDDINNIYINKEFRKYIKNAGVEKIVLEEINKIKKLLLQVMKEELFEVSDCEAKLMCNNFNDIIFEMYDNPLYYVNLINNYKPVSLIKERKD